jgi:hypothetical protein
LRWVVPGYFDRLTIRLLVAGDFGGEDADVVDAAVAFGVIHAVADYELVGNLEGYVVGFDGDEAALGFVEAGGDL